jgi:hypothetical protein
MLIGKYFRKMRLEKGLSESELASRISPDFQESFIWDFESGDDNDIDGMSIISNLRATSAQLIISLRTAR